jgi:hypothetical protein
MSDRLSWPKCPRCGSGDYKHFIDEAHGISGTYMAGSERFVCADCRMHTVTIESPNAADFPFRYEKKGERA